MKFLITILIVYFIYRFFIAKPALNGTESHQNINGNQKESHSDDDYIDFEEVE